MGLLEWRWRVSLCADHGRSRRNHIAFLLLAAVVKRSAPQVRYDTTGVVQSPVEELCLGMLTFQQDVTKYSQRSSSGRVGMRRTCIGRRLARGVRIEGASLPDSRSKSGVCKESGSRSFEHVGFSGG